MMSMPDDQKRLILHSNEQAQAFRQQRLDHQQEQIQNQSSFGLSSSESNTDDLTSPKDTPLNQPSATTGDNSHNDDADPNANLSHRLSGGSWSSVDSTSPTSLQPTNVQEERPLSPTSSNVARGFLKWFGSLTSPTKSQDTSEYYIEELTQRY